MPELFEGRSFPLSGAGSVAQALYANQGAWDNVGGAIQAYKRSKLMDSKLSDLGYDDQHALIAGAAPMTDADGNTMSPSQMTVRQLMLRKAAAGAQGDIATQPTLGDLTGDKIVGSPLEAFSDAPYSIAEKFGMYGRNVPAKVYVSKTQQEKYNQTHNIADLPQIRMVPTGDPDEVQVDARSSAQFLRQAQQAYDQIKQTDLNSWRRIMAGKFKNDADAQNFKSMMDVLEPWQNMLRYGFVKEASDMYPDALKFYEMAKKQVISSKDFNQGKLPGGGTQAPGQFPAAPAQPPKTPMRKLGSQAKSQAGGGGGFMLFSPKEQQQMMDTLRSLKGQSSQPDQPQ